MKTLCNSKLPAEGLLTKHLSKKYFKFLVRIKIAKNYPAQNG